MDKADVHWVYEKGIFDTDKEFEETLRRHGNLITFVDYLSFNADHIDYVKVNKYGPEPVMYRGSLNLARSIRRETNWVPGTYLNEKQLDCTFYYAKYGPYMLNREYMIMPLSEVVRQKEFIFDSFYRGGEAPLFIRPTSNMKRFHAGIFNIHKEYPDFKSLAGHLRAEDTELVLVAPKKQIRWEARLFMYKDTVVTGSVYLFHDKEKYKRIRPDTFIASWASNLIQKIGWYPDKLWSLDICSEGRYGDGDLKILEIGSYGSAGEYACDLDLYVDAANQAALEDFNEAYGN